MSNPSCEPSDLLPASRTCSKSERRQRHSIFRPTRLGGGGRPPKPSTRLNVCEMPKKNKFFTPSQIRCVELSAHSRYIAHRLLPFIMYGQVERKGNRRTEVIFLPSLKCNIVRLQTRVRTGPNGFGKKSFGTSHREPDPQPPFHLRDLI